MKTRMIFFLLFFLSAMTAMDAQTKVVTITKEKGKKEKESKKGWLGVSIQELTPKLAKSMDLKAKEGVLVSSVVRKSPADSAGIKEEDIILEFNGTKVDTPDELVKLVRETTPGKKVKVLVQRGDEKKSLSATVGTEKTEKNIAVLMAPRAADQAAKLYHQYLIGSSSGKLGLQLMELNDQLAEYFGATEGGVLVEQVEKKSAAEKAGFKAGDVIVKAGSRRVDEINDIMKALRKHEEGDTMKVEVLRKGATQILQVIVEKSEEEPFSNHFEMTPHGGAQTFRFKSKGFSPLLMPGFTPFPNGFQFTIPPTHSPDGIDEEEVEIEGDDEDGSTVEKDIRIKLEPRMQQLRIELRKMGKELQQELGKQKIRMKINADQLRKQVEEIRRQGDEIRRQAEKMKEELRLKEYRNTSL